MVFKGTGFLQQGEQKAACCSPGGLSEALPTRGSWGPAGTIPMADTGEGCQGWGSAPRSALEVSFKLQVQLYGMKAPEQLEHVLRDPVSTLKCSAGQTRAQQAQTETQLSTAELHPGVENANTDTPECTSYLAERQRFLIWAHINAATLFLVGFQHCIGQGEHTSLLRDFLHHSPRQWKQTHWQTYSIPNPHLVWKLMFLLLFSKPCYCPQQ